MQSPEVEAGPNRPETKRNASLFPAAVKTTKTPKVEDSEILIQDTHSHKELVGGSPGWHTERCQVSRDRRLKRAVAG